MHAAAVANASLPSQSVAFAWLPLRSGRTVPILCNRRADSSGNYPNSIMSEKHFSDQFIDLVTPHQSQLLGYLCAVLRNSSDAEDVLQQTYLELWSRFDQYDPSKCFFSWAKQIAKIKAVDFIRQNRRAKLQFRSEVIDILTEEMMSTSDAKQEESTRLSALRTCLGKLATTDRQLINKCYRSNRSFRHLASEMGRSPQSLGNSLRRIRLKLLMCIQQVGAALKREEELA